MNCVICGSALSREESWDGSTRLSCPLCRVVRCRSEKGQERPICGGCGRYRGDMVAQAEKIAEREES